MDVLLIEDNPADVYLMREEFDQLAGDHRLSVASSIIEARHALRHARPDIVLLDLSLPDSFGLETYRTVQAAAPDLPIIVLSGNEDQTVATEAVRSGAQDYVLKGRMDPEGLLRTLTYAIERARVKAALRQSEARFRRLYDSVPVGVFQMSDTGILQSVNATLTRTLGFDCEEDVLRAERAGCLYVDPDQKASARALLAEKQTLAGYEIELYHRRGQTVTMLVSAAAIRDELTGETTIEGTMVDITERKHAEKQLRLQAEVDELTGIANRRAFRAIATTAIVNSATAPGGVLPAVMLFDLDGFKVVNDSLGHAAGDDLLREVSRRVTAALRHEDVFARIGGDEFTILCSVSTREDLERVACKVRTVVAEPYELDAGTAVIGTSIGIARYPQDGTDYDALIAAADRAMYAAKKAGKGRFVFADQAA